MKNIFTNSELAHTYAQQTQREGRNSQGSFFFDGDTIYSYGRHFPIAKIITDSTQGEKILFTFRSYSNTTSKQVHIVSQATRQYEKILCYNPEGSHDENFNAWVNISEGIASCLLTARKPEKYLHELAIIQARANNYADFFKIDIPEKLKALLSIQNKSEFTEYQSKKDEYKKAETARFEKEQKKKFKEQLNKWLNGETSRVYILNKYDFLRLKENRVETTQAVQIPLEIAKRLYISIKEGTIKEGDKLLNYTIDKVGAQIKIGCHTFQKSYLLKFGAQLN
jgi:hypothetical protein